MAQVKIATNFTPPLVFDTSKAPAPSRLLRLIAPTVDASFGGLVGDLHYAPWGPARPGMGSLVVYGLAALVLIGALTLAGALWKAVR